MIVKVKPVGTAAQNRVAIQRNDPGKLRTIMIKREAIEARLAELEKSREQMLAALNAHAGAIEVCKQLLNDADTTPSKRRSKKAEAAPLPEAKAAE